MTLAADPANSHIAGTVRDAEFGGMTLRLLVAVPGRDAPVRVAMPAEQAQPVGVGDTVGLRFDLGAASVLQLG